MAVSNKKKKAILRSYPGKSMAELSSEIGLSKREVKAVLRSEGRLPAPSLKVPLTVAGAAIAFLALGLGAYSFFFGPGPAKLRRLSGDLNVLVVTIDTLRADRLGCYGYGRARTPVIDSVAASGVHFASAYCLQPVTLPSHATIFTGTHPARHGIADNGNFRLADEAVTVAEVLDGEGISTGAVVASFVLHRQFGLDQGFDTFDDSLSTGRKQMTAGFEIEEMAATVVSDRALEWIEKNAAKRWFLWLHYYDPHEPYDPPLPFREIGSHLYDGEVAYVDFELGRVIDELERRGLRERTLIIITSDHGESLGEHGELSHGLFLYEAAMRVPLIVSLPGTLPAGRTVSQTASLMDIAPTVLSAMGIALPIEIQGRSLMRLLFSAAADQEEVPVIMETMAPWYQHGWSPSSAIVADNHKFIDSPKPELYDLEIDPRELKNIYDKDLDRAGELASRLKELRTGYGESSLESGSAVKMDDVTRDRLARLGYIFSGPAPGTPVANAPDVKDMVEVIDMMKTSLALRTEGKEDEAFSLLEDVLERSPDNRQALTELGSLYALKKDFQNAEKQLKRLIQLEPEAIDAYISLGGLYALFSRREDAALLAQTALSKFPRSVKAQGLMGFLRLQQKDYLGALEHLNKAIESYPTYHEALHSRSVAYYFLGEEEKALEDLKTASRIVPGNKHYAQLVDKLEKEMEAR